MLIDNYRNFRCPKDVYDAYREMYVAHGNSKFILSLVRPATSFFRYKVEEGQDWDNSHPEYILLKNCYEPLHRYALSIHTLIIKCQYFGEEMPLIGPSYQGWYN